MVQNDETSNFLKWSKVMKLAKYSTCFLFFEYFRFSWTYHPQGPISEWNKASFTPADDPLITIDLSLNLFQFSVANALLTMAINVILREIDDTKTILWKKHTRSQISCSWAKERLKILLNGFS